MSQISQTKAGTAKAGTRLRAREMAFIAQFSVLMAAGAWISVPVPKPLVPFTMQTCAIFTALLCLGGRRGMYAVAVYLLLGAAGAPVFTGMRGGADVLLNTTGGYLLGFLALAGTYWLITTLLHAGPEQPEDGGMPGNGMAQEDGGTPENGRAWEDGGTARRVERIRLAACVAGLLACYAFGTAWFLLLYSARTGPIGLWTALNWCVLPFLVPDGVKLALASILARRIRKYLRLD